MLYGLYGVVQPRVDQSKTNNFVEETCSIDAVSVLANKNARKVLKLILGACLLDE